MQNMLSKKTRGWTHAMWVRLMLLLLFVGGGTLPVMADEYYDPVIWSIRRDLKIDGDVTYVFDWNIFNYDGNNSHYTTSPVLYFGTEKVADLGQIYRDNGGGITIWGSSFDDRTEDPFEGIRKKDHTNTAAKVVDWKGGKAYIKMYTAGGQSSKNAFLTVEVTFDHNYLDVPVDLNIKGQWHHKGGSVYSTTVSFKGQNDVVKPTASIPATSGTFTHNGNRSVKYEQQGLTPVKSNGTDWQYRFRMVNGRNSESYEYVSSQYGEMVAGEAATSYTGSFSIPSNHQPTVIYPTIDHFSKNNLADKKIQVSFTKIYDKVTLPGYVAPKNLKAVNSFWDDCIKVSWEDDKISGNSTKGSWVVLRSQDKKTWENASDKLGYSTKSFQDKNAANGVKYYYAVVFVPTDFNIEAGNLDKPEKCQDLYQVTSDAVARECTFAITSLTAEQDSKYEYFNLTWTISEPFPDTKPRTFTVYRSTNLGQWTSLDNVEVRSASQTTVTYQDKTVAGGSKCDSYRYRVLINIAGNEVMNTNETSYSLSGGDGIGVKDLVCSKGTFSNVVKCTWTAEASGNDKIKYTLYRRILGSDKAFEVITTQEGSATSFSYDDQTVNPGDYYEYKVESSTDCITADPDTGEEITVAYVQVATDDGFSIAYGVVSGRISYDGGTAVEGVTVNMEPESSSGLDKVKSYAMQFAGSATECTNIGVDLDESVGKSMFGDLPWTIQAYVKVLDCVDGTSIPVVQSGQNLGLYLTRRSSAWYLEGAYPTSESAVAHNTSNLCINLTSQGFTPTSSYINVALSYDGNKKYRVSVLDKTNKIAEATYTASYTPHYSGYYGLCFGAEDTAKKGYYWSGLMDEIRVWSGHSLKADDLKETNFLPLTGSEDDLVIYLPMNEGVQNQKTLYDNSFTGSRSNGHHARLSGKVSGTMTVPFEETKVGFSGKTNADGTFVIRRLPFNGEGTNYIVRPTMGTHKFNPSYQTRYISSSSLVHSAVDFTDESSFQVSGNVYYEGTSYPVKGAYLYVDGNLASRNGAAVTTDDEGAYTIDVPIGKHYISVKKDNHTFVRNGRFPEDKDNVGTLYTFEKDMSNLTFSDNTLVPVVGRVVGGEVQNSKPVALGKSKANIGRATITMTYDGSQEYSLNASTPDGVYPQYKQDPDSIRVVNAATSFTKSTAFIGAGNFDASRTITIETDPTTGEWSAMLPPVIYKVTAITLKNNPENISFKNMLGTIDASNPSNITVSKDTITRDSLEYVGEFCVRYHAPAVLDVTMHGQPDYFGVDSVTFENASGKEETIALIETKKVDGEDVFQSYRFGKSESHPLGLPVFRQYGKYKLDLYGHETYTNYDDDEPVVDLVPLANAMVKIDNPLSSATSVICDAGNSTYTAGDIYELDSQEMTLGDDGKLTYSFTAGMPNIQEENGYARTMSIMYDGASAQQTWTGDEVFDGTAIVLGMMTTGNNFMTAGPDKVTKVLRDPPGSRSFTTWTSGSSSTSKVIQTVNVKSETENTLTTMAGLKTSIITGLGVANVNEAETTNNASAGLKITGTLDENHEWTETTSNETGYSTSSEPDYVGAVGDVFIGTSTNVIYGDAKELKLRQNPSTKAWALGVENTTMLGQEFGTIFAYDANMIENILIPGFYEKRDSLLTKYAYGNQNVSAGTEAKYISMVPPTDPRFGSSNSDKSVWGSAAKPISQSLDATAGKVVGPSYVIIMPKDWKNDGGFQDQVVWYNEQAKLWKQHLANNEQIKLQAIEQREEKLRKNFSFSAGAGITETHTHEKANEWTVTTNCTLEVATTIKIGASFNSTGAENEFKYTQTTDLGVGGGNSESETDTYTYTLQEDGDDDYISVDVLDAGEHEPPIFYTRAGVTSCPYEDEVVTKYYKPGSVLMEKTVQIEKPELAISEGSSAFVTGVPSGKAANFTIDFINNSETKESLWFNLNVVDQSNPNGASVWMDGDNITKGRTIYLPYGVTKKTIQLKQTNEDFLSFEGVQLKLASQCQKDDSGIFPEIASYLTINAEFTAAGSDINLASDAILVNTNSTNELTLSMSGYDINSKILDRIALQVYNPSTNSWDNIQQYVKEGDSRYNGTSYLKIPALKGAETLDYIYDIRDSRFADQNFKFRAVTISLVNNAELITSSEEINVIRDMSRPQLIANPTPSNGILTADGEVSITFNEDIRNNVLSKTNNFVVKGILNDAQVMHESALSLPAAAGTKTDATFDMGKAFAFNFWLKQSTAGQILQQGSADQSFRLSVNSDNKLVVGIGSQEYVATAALPKNEWNFISVSYDGSGEGAPQLNVDCANDATTLALLRNVDAAEYAGNGPITIGGDGLNGQIHELSLWNNARSTTEALSGMYTTKNVYTPGLVGYWQLAEGHGTKASDLSRNRHMTVPSTNAWYMNNTNYALNLDGSAMGQFTVSSLSTDDYLAEAWFRAEKQTTTASILSLNQNDLDIRLNAAGQMEMVAKGTTYTVTSEAMNDNAWHHIALNVLNSTNGSAILYVDGKAQRQLNASSLPSLSGNVMVGGRRYLNASQTPVYDQPLKGAIDEVRVWHGRRSASAITDNMYRRVDAQEPGLVAYYPMEKSVRDEVTLQTSTVFSGSDFAGISQTGLVLYKTSGAKGTAAQASNAPALKSAPAMESVNYNFVASERKILINLDADPARIEGCTLQFSVMDVRDANANFCNPITWTAYVQQNQLKWGNNEVAVRKTGEQNETFEVTIENNSASNESWTLSNMPSWLSVNTESGNLGALGKKTLTFTVNAAAPIGKYEEVVYLTGNTGISEPLYISLTSMGNVPDWSVDPTAFEYSLGVVGQLKIDGIYSSDTEDIVGAFQNGKCVGVAHPQYMSKYDSYFLAMTVYGETSPETTPLVFKVYDASTGITYPVVNISGGSPAVTSITFNADALHGSFKSPVLFTPSNSIEQETALRKGWSWLSLYVTPSTADAKVASIFKNSPNATYVKNKAIYSQRSGSSWVGELESLSAGMLYKVKSSEAGNVCVTGTPANNLSISLVKGWNWIGYTSQSTMSLGDAFGSANPIDGDIVKSQNGFAIYTDGTWLGSLAAMTPGLGYAYKSGQTVTTKSFKYPAVSATSNKAPRKIKAEEYVNAGYSNNMTMIAVVMNGDEVVEDAEVAVICENELRAHSTSTIKIKSQNHEELPAHFLTIGGDKAGDVLRFVVTVDGFDYTLPMHLFYESDAQYGSVKVPYVLQMGDATSIKSIEAGDNDQLYDLAGRRLSKKTKNHGIYIQNGEKIVK